MNRAACSTVEQGQRDAAVDGSKGIEHVSADLALEHCLAWRRGYEEESQGVCHWRAGLVAGNQGRQQFETGAPVRFNVSRCQKDTLLMDGDLIGQKKASVKPSLQSAS